MNIDGDLFTEPEGFREMLGELHADFDTTPFDEPDLWALRQYCLDVADNPPAMFVTLAKDRKLWNRPGEAHWRQSEAARLGEAAPPALSGREDLIAETRRYVGQFLPGGHEVLNMGIQHQRDGLVSWERHSDDALAAIVGDLRAGRRGEAPELLTPQQAARALGGESLSALLAKAKGEG